MHFCLPKHIMQLKFMYKYLYEYISVRISAAPTFNYYITILT